MSDIICVTNRKLCETDYLTQLENIAKAKPKAIILREKDLSESDYEKLAKEVIAIAGKYDVPCILHSFTDAAISLNADMIHLPISRLTEMTAELKSHFRHIGASCHSVSDAQLAQKLGCTYITAGHVFPTDCKKGVTPRGLEFLADVCKNVEISVYAIGGIDADSFPLVTNAGAKGACVMSGLMTAENPVDYLEHFDKENENEI